MALGIDELRGKPPAINRGPVTGRVTKVDTQGVWVVPVGGDLRTPVGPCRGPSDIPVGTVVMVIYTQERPWVFGAELLTSLNADVRDLVLLELAEAAAQELDEAVAQAAQDALDAYALTVTAALAEKVDTAAYRDTGRRLVVEAGDVTDLPDLEVVLRRRGDVVTVWTREATTAATHAGATALYTLPAGFRPDPAHVAAPVLDETGADLATLLAAAAGGALTLTAVAGERHHGSLTYLTSDTWPGSLPGTEDT